MASTGEHGGKSQVSSVTWKSGADMYSRATTVELREGRRVSLLQLPGREADSPTVVLFCHGSCASMSQYFPAISAINAAGYGCIAYDWLGCGNSDKPEAWGAYAFKELERDLEAVWDLARKATPHAGVFVVGHSYGTHLVMRLALTLQQRPPGPASVGRLR
ncbi:Alpha/Beta hydrolase protein [Baffinella frigidus]|nr:Alpha/Beta hydrolase protein [Cryptophyta sp. CCMP2293]